MSIVPYLKPDQILEDVTCVHFASVGIYRLQFREAILCGFSQD